MEIVDLKTFSQDEVVRKVVSVLQSGGLVIYPTDTVYGVAVDATNNKAVQKLLKYKGKQFTKPIPIAVNSQEMAERYVGLNPQARNLYAHFLPGPLTVVSKSKHRVAELLEPVTGTLGVRWIQNELVQQIIKSFGKPITTTSALNSAKRPYSVETVLQELAQASKQCIDLILDAGQLSISPPSTVVDTTYNQAVVLRAGVVDLEEVEKLTSRSPEETINYGQKLIKQYGAYLDFKSVIFALSGDLGAGKTHFTKGVALGSGIKEEIQSPTFIIEREYAMHLDKKLYHLDVWRLQDLQELESLRLDESIQAGNVFVIEWAERLGTWFNQIVDDAVIVWVDFRYGENELEREITVRIHR